MKKIIALATLVAASTSMMAMDLEYFLGAGAQRVDMNVKISSERDAEANGEASLKDTALLLKGGIILEKAHRVSLSYVKNSDEGLEATTILGSYDYLIPMNEQFRLYAGLHAGNTNVDIESGDVDDNISFSGLAYGAQVGGIYDITKNIQFEAGLAYTKYNVSRGSSVTVLSDGSTSSWANIELKDSTSMFAGLNYKF